MLKLCLTVDRQKIKVNGMKTTIYKKIKYIKSKEFDKWLSFFLHSSTEKVRKWSTIRAVVEVSKQTGRALQEFIRAFIRSITKHLYRNIIQKH